MAEECACCDRTDSPENPVTRLHGVSCLCLECRRRAAEIVAEREPGAKGPQYETFVPIGAKLGKQSHAMNWKMTAHKVRILRMTACEHMERKEVAACLGISSSTVGDHIQQILQILGCTTIAGAYDEAIVRGLVEPLARHKRGENGQE